MDSASGSADLPPPPPAPYSTRHLVLFSPCKFLQQNSLKYSIGKLMNIRMYLRKKRILKSEHFGPRNCVIYSNESKSTGFSRTQLSFSSRFIFIPTYYAIYQAVVAQFLISFFHQIRMFISFPTQYFNPLVPRRTLKYVFLF